MMLLKVFLVLALVGSTLWFIAKRNEKWKRIKKSSGKTEDVHNDDVGW